MTGYGTKNLFYFNVTTISIVTLVRTVSSLVILVAIKYYNVPL